MREVRDRLVAHLPALTPRAAQQMRLVVPRRTVLTHIVTTVCSHVYGPTTFSHTTKLPDRHIDSVTISDDTPDASDTTSPQVTQRINPQRARNFGLASRSVTDPRRPRLPCAASRTTRRSQVPQKRAPWSSPQAHRQTVQLGLLTDVQLEAVDASVSVRLVKIIRTARHCRVRVVMAAVT